ncbi:probable tRNA methyltransferase 9B isoform X1 [Salvelinus fontinalis]|uniref:probable tRNA methyltransferase 9B isoform X1 n=1 Tax=Salvelinus fontinalis TaxID=8038 RepID=UPI002485D1A3|nr:probable tRNA methyltransferase 9B isoform X1 [Salvelinus fontinalis]
MTVMEDAATRLEREHVHSVYEKIAPYFNDSRYKAWPKVRQFLLEHEPGSIIADVGCGNGKYLHVNGSVFKLGCDVCFPLVDSARSQGHEVQLCDCLRLPYRDSCFDGVLSIAVIHHLSTKERRIRAIKEMARTLRVGGRIMIYVWAMEQTRRKFQKQDIFVPWNPNPPSPNLGGERPTPRWRGAAQSVSEYLYSDSKDEHRKVKSTSFMLDEEMACSPQQRLWFFSRSLDSVFDFGSLTISRANDNHSPSTETTTPPPSTALVQECGLMALPDLVTSYQMEHTEGQGRPGEREAGPPGDLKQDSSQSPQDSEGEPEAASCLRYYHVFREGELAELIKSHVEELHVLYSCFDHANWCVVAEKVQVWKI